ncbi:alpha/beta fold hydrolase [Aeromicrobium sp. Leaf350]|uniref:alpha/beta fold hydrolase n=1 Tax=Aeromicrobium sp. Leaf350 TaxID=2876565 RepID=UPI001E4BC19D|nr:alpha/beta hydrolase [Aeromicrobium sp. Leaf350]
MSAEIAAGMPQLEGVEHRWIDVDGVRIHVAEAGVGNDGPPIVLIHGWPQHWWCWHHVIPLLAERHHVVALDSRGAGWSDAPSPGGDTYDKRVVADELAAVITQLGLDRPVVVGHDWGAWLAILIGGRHPELTRGVVATAIVAPWAKIETKDLWRFLYQPLVGGPWGAFLQRGLGQVVLRRVFALGSRDGKPWSERAVEPYLARFREPARAAAGRSTYATFLTREFRAVQKRTYQAPYDHVPLLFLPGRRDGVLVPRIVAGGLVRPTMSMHVVDDAGHWVPEEQPEVLVEHVEAFIAGLDA